MDLGIVGLTEIEEIGSDEFATSYTATYVASEVGGDHRVLVKVLSGIDTKGRKRFDQERQVMTQATGHANIATVLDSGYTDPGGYPYLVAEHTVGESLQDRLDTHGPLDTGEAIEIIGAIADGLRFAHSIGIVHNDIKPANIVPGPNQAKLNNFGIASVSNASGTGHVGDSLAYTAPETFTAAQDPDGKILDPHSEQSDFYSLAVTLYGWYPESHPSPPRARGR
jgi:serine/threonine protein kinase